MNSMILGLLAETPIHPGAGRSVGVIDLPVAREKATDYPVIVGSSVKGALLETARQRGMSDPDRARIFGQRENAGALLVSDVRLLLLPVRSLDLPFRWITCPHLIERCVRDLVRAGQAPDEPSQALSSDLKLAAGTCAGAGGDAIFLEERRFEVRGPAPGPLVELLRRFIRHPETAMRLERQLVVLADEDFAWFARYGLTITARNQLEPDTKRSNNLWYEETLPPDSVLFGMLAERDPGVLDQMRRLFRETPYLRVGGNETVGQGWLAVTTLPAAQGGAAPARAAEVMQ
jgi:CRISPR-associated protein Cmr4